MLLASTYGSHVLLLLGDSLNVPQCLSRPCVYCTLLLTVLIVSLFDFSGDWFAPRWPGDHISITETIGSALSGNATVTEVLGQTAGAVMSAMNSSGAVLEGVKRKIGMGSSEVAAGGDSFEWLRILAEKKAFRIPCVDVMVRL